MTWLDIVRQRQGQPDLCARSCRVILLVRLDGTTIDLQVLHKVKGPALFACVVLRIDCQVQARCVIGPLQEEVHFVGRVLDGLSF